MKGGELKKHLIIGNVYRPPHNVVSNYTAFIDGFSTILNELTVSRSEIIIAGDYNIDLLRLHEKSIIGDFFTTLLSLSFCPKITLPTRFTDKKGALLDNFFCKVTNLCIEAKAGILMNQLSDHHPYFLLLNLDLKKHNALHQVKITNYPQTTVENFCNDIHDSCLTDLNSSLQQEP